MQSAATSSIWPLPAPEPARVRPSREDIDEETLTLAQAGSSEALERFVKHYQGPVFAFLSRSLGRGPHVEDLAQEVFLRVMRALPRFTRTEAKVSTWIFQIAVRLMKDRNKRPQRTLVAVPDDLRDRRQNPEESCAERRTLSSLERLAAELPEEQRMTLVLIEFHGLSHQEVSVAMNCQVATVKTRLHRARSHLREGLLSLEGELR